MNQKNEQNRDEMNKLYEMSYMRGMNKWYSWESPIGLSIFFLTLTLIAAIIKLVFWG